MSLRMEWLDTPAYRLALWRGGEGPKIIVISGGPGLASNYLRAALADLTASHEVFFFDQPGCGESEGLSPTIEQTVEATNSLIEQVSSGGPFELVCHSWGAYLAARYCAATTAPPVSTTLLNPVPFDRAGYDAVGARLTQRVAPDDMLKIGQLAAEGSRRAGSMLMHLARPAYFGRSNQLPDIEFDYNIATFNSVASSLDDFDFWSSLSRMGRITFVFGDADYISNADFNGKVPSTAQVIVLKSGHFSMMDAREQVLSIIQAAHR